MKQIILKTDNQVSWNGNEYQYNGYELLDEISLHLILNTSYFCFLAGETNINGVDCNSIQDIINALN